MIASGHFGRWLSIQFLGLPVGDAYTQNSVQFMLYFPRDDQHLQCSALLPCHPLVVSSLPGKSWSAREARV